ncbi:predicted protein [Micromonas commoda]|uniref:Uncharacterized protein n=1 Tax=Micromonas commoda (strain RCC299 / NOUM17 / CCMP2709) TaxID=296587 RepID=C1FGJ8_MICCC|nr:predicted protein [Micromonas commoda]ACO69556.1 predicted protein [Micromonas commoda]|eukprot:XP_002508298.1 predicted protein [Micromonas commoda]
MAAAGATLGIAGGLVRTGARAIGPPRPNLPAAAARGLGRARRLRAGASTSSATNEARAGEDDGDAPHVPVLMRQVLDAFDGRSLRCYVDGTMGAGGHASAIIRAHPELRTFVGFDLRIHTVQSNFRHMRERLAELQLADGGVDAILMDLGVSSMHLDTPERGFSFMNDGPLDMRMGPSAKMSAADVVNEWPEEEIARVIRDYGEEKHWRLLARRICDARGIAPIETTRQLVHALGRIPGVKKGRSGGIHPATRTFQGIRIAVNEELAVVEEAIPAAVDALAPGGRLAIITFHSLEDKLVKRAFRTFAGIAPASDRPLSAWEPQPEAPPKIVKLVTRKPVVADDDEVGANARSRSAKLRVCEKL